MCHEVYCSIKCQQDAIHQEGHDIFCEKSETGKKWKHFVGNLRFKAGTDVAHQHTVILAFKLTLFANHRDLESALDLPWIKLMRRITVLPIELVRDLCYDVVPVQLDLLPLQSNFYLFHEMFTVTTPVSLVNFYILLCLLQEHGCLVTQESNQVRTHLFLLRSLLYGCSSEGSVANVSFSPPARHGRDGVINALQNIAQGEQVVLLKE
jgi:hypothetical protein